MRVQGWGLSDPGRRRDHNEDSYLCNDLLKLYAVADGMGGHLGGERASHMAIQILERHFSSQSLDVAPSSDDHARPASAEAMTAPTEDSGVVDDITHPQLGLSARSEALRGAIGEADRAIYEDALGDPAFLGMGTTLTAIFFEDRIAHVGHVGDSRAYLSRNGTFRQLTDDHSWIQDQVRAGILSPDEARESRFRNIITRSVGFEPAVRPDMRDLLVQPGDRFLICSDGLSNHLSTEEIGEIVGAEICHDTPGALVAMANARGGDDNVTCVCIEVSED